MNFNINFTRTPEFFKFKEGIGVPDALEYILNLGQYCQIERKAILHIPDELSWRLILNLPTDTQAVTVRDNLLSSGLVKQESGSAHSFHITFFEESNAPMIASWKNGSQGGRPKQKNQTK